MPAQFPNYQCQHSVAWGLDASVAIFYPRKSFYQCQSIDQTLRAKAQPEMLAVPVDVDPVAPVAPVQVDADADADAAHCQGSENDLVQ